MMIGVLVVVILALLGLIVVLVKRMEFLTDEAEDAVDHEHAKCLSAVMQYVGNEYAAKVLEAAAHDWEAVEEHHRLKVLARLKYQAGGKSMPAIWMEDRADRLRGGEDITEFRA